MRWNGQGRRQAVALAPADKGIPKALYGQRSGAGLGADPVCAFPGGQG